MAVIQPCALVLWGTHCDGAAAAIFIRSLRAAGLRVWLVGISGRRIAGAHGLRLQPDLRIFNHFLKDPLLPKRKCTW